MSLYTTPPETVTVSGIEYPIDTDFRIWIEFQQILLNDLQENEKTEKVLQIIDRIGLPQTKEALEAAVQFYVGASTEKSTGGGKNVQAFDFTQDSEYIFSAFYQFYRIDLAIEKMHWWRFKAFFKSLPDDCEMCKIMGYRTIDLKKVPKEQKQFYREMKQRYALSGNIKTGYRTEQEMKDYVAKRFEEAKKHMSQVRRDE